MKTQTIIIFAAPIFIWLDLSETAYGQQQLNSPPIQNLTTQQKGTKSTWMDFGVGISGRGQALTLSFNVELKKKAFISLSYDKAYYPSHIDLLAPADYRNGSDASSVSLKLGKVQKTSWCLISYSIGPSLTKLTRFSSTDVYVLYSYVLFIPVYNPHYEKQWTIDLATVAGLAFDLKIIPATKKVGMMINPFFNINARHAYAGLTFGIALGKLKS